MFIKDNELMIVKTVKKNGEDINIYQYKNNELNNNFYILIESVSGSLSEGFSNRYAEFKTIDDAIREAELFLDMINDVKEGKVI